MNKVLNPEIFLRLFDKVKKINKKDDWIQFLLHKGTNEFTKLLKRYFS